MRLLIGLLVLALAVFAFVPYEGNLKANVPFTFEMAGLIMPAGEYALAIDPQHGTVYVRGETENGIVLSSRLNQGTGEWNVARLVFNRYDDRYFLAELWHPSIAVQVVKSKQERELVTSRLVTGVKPVRVVVLASVR